MDNGPNWCITLKERQRVGEDEEEDVSIYWIEFWKKWLFWKLKYETPGRPLCRTRCGKDYRPNWRNTQKVIQEDEEEDLSSYWIYLLTRNIPGQIDLCEEVVLEFTMDQTVVRQWRKTEGRWWWRRRRKQLLDKTGDMGLLGKLKYETRDRTLWRTSFGMDCGPTFVPHWRKYRGRMKMKKKT